MISVLNKVNMCRKGASSNVKRTCLVKYKLIYIHDITHIYLYIWLQMVSDESHMKICTVLHLYFEVKSVHFLQTMSVRVLVCHSNHVVKFHVKTEWSGILTMEQKAITQTLRLQKQNQMTVCLTSYQVGVTTTI